MSSRETLLDSLVSDLAPVRPPPDLRWLVGGWLLVCAAYVVVLTHLLGPVRPTALEQLQAHPRFLAEMVLGGLAVAALATWAFRAAVPGAGSAAARWLAMAAAGLWLSAIALGLVVPALEPSMLGKRDHCYLETLVAALPPLLVALFLQRRLYPLRALRSALLAGLAAGALPALYMQVACMYVPTHALLFHIGPGVVTGVLAPLILVAYRRFALSRG